MASIRGRGRVVPRQKAQPGAASPADTNLLLHACGGPPHIAVEPPPPPPSSTGHEAASQAVETAASRSNNNNNNSSNSGGGFRCADFITQRSTPVPHLAPSKLGTAASRQLLTTGAPLLLPQLRLARCSLRTPPSGPAPPPGDSTGSSGSSSSTDDKLQLPVLCSPAANNRFIVADASKNLPGGCYHLRKPETSSLMLTFPEWQARWQTWQQSRLLLTADVCQWEMASKTSQQEQQEHLRLWPNTATWPHLTQLLAITPTGAVGGAEAAAAPTNTQPPAAAQGVLDWPLLLQLLQDGSWAPRGGLQLQAGGADALLPARYETHDRLVCQVGGRQRLLLLPPDLAWHRLYPYAVQHPYDRYSAVDWEDPEVEHWPRAAEVRGLLCDLAPGDTLLIPAYCFVHSQLMQPACVSLVLQLVPLPTRLSSPPALLLQLSRMMELWFAAEAGPANVRRWFKALAEGREWQLLKPQLQTVKGYKLLQCCRMALEQLQRVLSLLPADQGGSGTAGRSGAGSGAISSALAAMVASDAAGACSHVQGPCGTSLECAARRVLSSMCDGRLMPTPWLNEGIPDPLYLQHPTRYYLIEEDAEAARYRSLFRHRLIANRPDWMEHATQLQLAPPGTGGRSLLPAPLIEGSTAAALIDGSTAATGGTLVAESGGHEV